MRKVMLLVFALIVAACGDSADSAAESAGPEATVTAAPAETSTTQTSEDADSTAAVESTTSSTAPDAVPSFDGPPAPDFEMALSDGSTFSLSDEQKPVYLVFWAEW